MAKLIIDEETLKLACSKLGGQPIYSGSDGKFISPGIVDLLANDNRERWQPGDERSQLLVLGGEACRELIFQAERIKDKNSRNRVIKSMTVPLCSLMDQIHQLMTLLNDEESRTIRSEWPRHDRQTYKDIGRQFRKKRFNGPVRKVRNKLAAHLDSNVFTDQEIRHFSFEEFLKALGDSLILMNLIVNHPNIFSWIRWMGSSEKEDFHIVETFFGYPICVRWVTDVEGKVIDVGLLQLADDPRFQIQEYVIQAIKVYNDLVDELGLSRSQVSKIWARPSVDLQSLKQ